MSAHVITNLAQYKLVISEMLNQQLVLDRCKLIPSTPNISSPVSVVQLVNTTVSPGHTLSDDESNVTVEVKFYHDCT